MKAILLDKNINAKRLAKACNLEGLVDCRRLPAELFDALDDVILRYAIEQDVALLTLDRPIAEQNSKLLADGFPGIVIVEFDPASPRFMTVDAAAKILRELKANCDDWHTWDIANCVVRLMPKTILIQRVLDEKLELTSTIERSTPNWTRDIATALHSIE